MEPCKAMPRDGSNIYSAPSGTTAVSGTAVASAPYNALVSDLTTDLNAARPISAGGTGATSASAARTNLGVSATDATITAIAALDFSVTGSMLYSTAADTFSLLTSTVAGRALLTAADASAQRTALSLGTAALKATGTSGNTVPLLDGANTWSNTQNQQGQVNIGAGIASGSVAAHFENSTVTNNKMGAYFQGAGTVFTFVPFDGGSYSTSDEFGYDFTGNYWSFDSATVYVGGSHIVTRTASETLTNKTLSSPAFSGSTSSAFSVNAAWTFTNSSQPVIVNGTSQNGKIKLQHNSSDAGFIGANATNSLMVIDSTNSTVQLSVNNSTGLVTVGDGGIQAPIGVSSETSGTLTSASRNKQVNASGDVTINDGVFTQYDRIEIYAGASARSIVQDTGMTLRLDGSATTGTRSLAARGRAAIYFVSNSEAIVSGMGVS